MKELGKAQEGEVRKEREPCDTLGSGKHRYEPCAPLGARGRLGSLAIHSTLGDGSLAIHSALVTYRGGIERYGQF